MKIEGDDVNSNWFEHDGRNMIEKLQWGEIIRRNNIDLIICMTAELFLRDLIFDVSGKNVIVKGKIRVAGDMEHAFLFKLVELELNIIKIEIEFKCCVEYKALEVDPVINNECIDKILAFVIVDSPVVRKTEIVKCKHLWEAYCLFLILNAGSDPLAAEIYEPAANFEQQRVLHVREINTARDKNNHQFAEISKR